MPGQSAAVGALGALGHFGPSDARLPRTRGKSLSRGRRTRGRRPRPEGAEGAEGATYPPQVLGTSRWRPCPSTTRTAKCASLTKMGAASLRGTANGDCRAGAILQSCNLNSAILQSCNSIRRPLHQVLFLFRFSQFFSKPKSTTRNFLKPRNIIPGPKPEKHPLQT